MCAHTRGEVGSVYGIRSTGCVIGLLGLSGINQDWGGGERYRAKSQKNSFSTHYCE
jgi:hypothetical protein